MYVLNIKIQNIRSISDLQLDFENPAGWHVLIGDNGSGKSTILKSIALAIIGPSEAPVLRLDLEKYLSYGKKEGSVEIKLVRHDQDSRAGQARPLSPTTAFAAGIQISSPSYSEGIENIPLRVSSLKQYKHAKTHIWSERPGWFSTSFGPFRRFSGGNRDWEKVYYSNPRAASHLSVFGEDVALTEGLEWLVKLNYRTLEGDDEATTTLNGLKRFINRSELLPHGARISEISSNGIEIEDGYGQKNSVLEMSDGFRSVLSLTFELIRQMVRVYGAKAVFSSSEEEDVIIQLPGVVMIDEIDAHLHPTWQIRIGNWFLKYFPQVQFIVTTHSPLICRSAINGSIWRLSAPNSEFTTYKVKGTEKDRLLYGNVLEAFGTELFGSKVDRSEEGQEKLERLSELETLHTFQRLNKEEQEELSKLQKTFPLNDQIKL